MSYMKLASSLALLALAGCAAKEKIVIKEVPVEVLTPVAAPCVAKEGRPVEPTPIRGRVTREEWNARAPGAKAETIRAQAGVRMNYQDMDRAATSGCK